MGMKFNFKIIERKLFLNNKDWIQQLPQVALHVSITPESLQRIFGLIATQLQFLNRVLLFNTTWNFNLASTHESQSPHDEAQAVSTAYDELQLLLAANQEQDRIWNTPSNLILNLSGESEHELFVADGAKVG